MTVTDNDIKNWDRLVRKIVDKYMIVYKDRSDIDYDDVYQIARIGLFKALESYDDTKGNFINFASKAISRIIIREMKLSDKSKDDVEFTDIEDDSYEDNLDTQIDFNRALDRLQASDYIKDILRLRYNGHSCNEIGRMLGKSYQNIHAIIKRYKDKLL